MVAPIHIAPLSFWVSLSNFDKLILICPLDRVLIIYGLVLTQFPQNDYYLLGSKFIVTFYINEVLCI